MIHGTRIAYRIHRCRCELCLDYQRGINTRNRSKLQSEGKCLDCSQPVGSEHRRCAACRETRAVNQRNEYRPSPKKIQAVSSGWMKDFIAPKVKATSKGSWWMGIDRDTLRAESERRFVAVETSTAHVHRAAGPLDATRGSRSSSGPLHLQD